jgi:hypothetical protein
LIDSVPLPAAREISCGLVAVEGEPCVTWVKSFMWLAEFGTPPFFCFLVIKLGIVRFAHIHNNSAYGKGRDPRVLPKWPLLTKYWKMEPWEGRGGGGGGISRNPKPTLTPAKFIRRGIYFILLFRIRGDLTPTCRCKISPTQHCRCKNPSPPRPLSLCLMIYICFGL